MVPLSSFREASNRPRSVSFTLSKTFISICFSHLHESMQGNGSLATNAKSLSASLLLPAALSLC